MGTSHAADLYSAYRFILTRPSTLPSDLADEFGHNMRYSRELLGALTGAKLIVLDTSTDFDYFVAKPVPEDKQDAVFAKAFKVDKPVETATTPKGKSKPAKPAKPASKDYHPCGCGCGENVPPKSNYRPGHDARHAGAIGRQIASHYVTGEPLYDRRDYLDLLPSDSLKAKAERVAETAIAKIEAKNAKAAAKANHTVEGTIKVGKTEQAAIKDTNTGEVTYLKDGAWVMASATATKTFQEG